MFSVITAARGRFLVRRAVLLGSAAVAAIALPAAPALAQTPGDDTIENTTERVLTGGIDFGAGTDLFRNKSILRFDKAPAPLNLSFIGLERFANDGGLVDLRNERAGDTLTLSGAYEGSGEARLALDISGATVDRLIVQGAATGKTAVILQGRPEDATLLADSIEVIRAGPGSSANAFRLAWSDIGLIRYGMNLDTRTGVYSLNASAGRAVYHSVRASEGLGVAWRASADAFGAEQAMARAAGGDRGRVWAQFHVGMADRDGADNSTLDVGYEQETFGGQAGMSLGARPMLGGEAAFGLTGGYLNSSQAFDDGGAEVDMRTINGGVYGAWRRGNLFASGLVKIDQHDLEIDDAMAGYQGDLEGLTWGGQAMVGYRLLFGGIAFEPTVGLEYLNSTLDDLKALGQTVSFEDRDGFASRIGAQAMARRELADGGAVTWTANFEAVHDFDGDVSGTLHSNGQSDEVRLEALQDYSRAQIGVQFETPGGVETYVQGEGRFGDGLGGGGVRIGARYRF